eukprot:CAMPEP_0114226024 /NCGR_PEP_ID=MMETSP0058-20121206/1006_1 /TAXON_ID=36894 /ORGANISM="Pyramimonas parkeae, CCMP726" /LENGTH=810 /DNA_ID=CAMNT_0001336711 /DNA_START=326 /DNA_END=2755 /DNA_ORIENTATION=-
MASRGTRSTSKHESQTDFNEDDNERSRQLTEEVEVLQLGEDIETSCALVDQSLMALLKALHDLETWRSVVTAEHVLPTNVLAQITVIASQVLRGKTSLVSHMHKLRMACNAAAPKKLIRDTAILQQDMRLAKKEAHLCEQKTRVAEAKTHALDNRVAIAWFKLSYNLTLRRMSQRHAANMRQMKGKLALKQKQIEDSIKAREFAEAKKRHHDRQGVSKQPATLEEWFRFHEMKRQAESAAKLEGEVAGGQMPSTDIRRLGDTAHLAARAHYPPAGAPVPPGTLPPDPRQYGQPRTAQPVSTSYQLQPPMLSSAPSSLFNPLADASEYTIPSPGARRRGGSQAHNYPDCSESDARSETEDDSDDAASPARTHHHTLPSADSDQPPAYHVGGAWNQEHQVATPYESIFRPQPPPSAAGETATTSEDAGPGSCQPTESRGPERAANDATSRDNPAQRTNAATLASTGTPLESGNPLVPERQLEPPHMFHGSITTRWSNRRADVRGSTQSPNRNGLSSARGKASPPKVPKLNTAAIPAFAQGLSPEVATERLDSASSSTLSPRQSSRRRNFVSPRPAPASELSGQVSDGAATWRVTAPPYSPGGTPRDSASRAAHAAPIIPGMQTGLAAVESELFQENLPVPMKEVYTRAELLECRIAHSKQLHRVQIAFEARLQILNEYWKKQLESHHKSRTRSASFSHRTKVQSGKAQAKHGPQVKIVEHSFPFPKADDYHHDMTNLGNQHKPTPPLPMTKPDPYQSHDCRVSYVKYRVGSRADKFVQQQQIGVKTKQKHVKADPFDAVSEFAMDSSDLSSW